MCRPQQRCVPPLGHLATIAVAVALSLGACGRSTSPASPPASVATAEAPQAGEAAALAGAATATAGQPAPTPAPVKVLLWHAYRDDERKAMDALVKSWNDSNPAVVVEALAVPYDALIDKVQVAIPRGNGPDLVVIAHDKIGTWARDGLIAPLGEFATPERLKRFLPATVRPLVFERAAYGLPLAFKSTVLFYNRKLVPQPPATMADLVAASKPHLDAKEGKFGLAFDAADLYSFAAFLHAFGGRAVSEDGRSLTIDTPEAAAAIEAVRKLHGEGIVPKGVTGFIVTAMFNDSKAPFVINGPWFLAEIDPAIDFGVAPLPMADNGKPLQPYLGSEAVLLSAHTKQRAAALSVMDYLTGDEAALTRMRLGKQLVANVKAYENPEFATSPVVKVFRAQAEVAVPMSNSVEAGVVWAPYSGALRRAIFGDQAAAVALAQAAKEAAAALATMKK